MIKKSSILVLVLLTVACALPEPVAAGVPPRSAEPQSRPAERTPAPASDAQATNGASTRYSGSYRGMPDAPHWTLNREIDLVYTGQPTIDGRGSEADPYVVSCAGSDVRLQGDGTLRLSGRYVVLVDCQFPNGRVRIDGEHIALDNVHTSGINKNGFVIRGKDVHISNSSARDHWHNQQDRHGFFVTCGSETVVIRDVETSGNSGDGFQAAHGCRTPQKPRVRDVFVGGMTCEGNRENCLDLKYVDGAVLTGMRSSGHGPSGAGFESGSDGSAVIFGSDGDSLNAWLIDSVTDDPIGIRVEDGNGAVVLGNRFNGPVAIALQKHGEPLDIRNNVIASRRFIGRAQRPQNFCIQASGNVRPDGSSAGDGINANMLRQAKCLRQSASTDISDLEARFLKRFGFPLES
ncbi:MAG: hypothetical protein NXH85_17610 [Pseudomonadaceae bacterium]|nr:hypothetical protein [Pseudomonadaceae bacterium]